MLPRDLESLYEWSEQWQMIFNVDKCKVLHVGRNNSKHVYSMGGKDLQAIESEKDLGVLFTLH